MDNQTFVYDCHNLVMTPWVVTDFSLKAEEVSARIHQLQLGVQVS